MSEQLAGQTSEEAIPRRDLIILPLLVLLTIVLTAGIAEYTFRTIYPSQKADSCVPQRWDRRFARPGCTSWTKTPEGPWVENRYNDCGYRSPEPCHRQSQGPAPLALIGSSVAQGFLVPYDHTLAAYARRELSLRCEKPITVQNLGAENSYGWKLLANVREAVALHPSAIVYVVNAYDIKSVPDQQQRTPRVNHDIGERAIGFLDQAKVAASESRLVYMLSAFEFHYDGLYLRLFARDGTKADFLRTPFTAQLINDLDRFDRVLDDVSKLAASQNIPLILLYVPERAPVIIVESNREMPGLDPQAMPRYLNNLATKHKIYFVDATRNFGRRMPSSKYFYANDSHPTGAAHAIFAHALGGFIGASGLKDRICGQGS